MKCLQYFGRVKSFIYLKHFPFILLLINRSSRLAFIYLNLSEYVQNIQHRNAKVSVLWHVNKNLKKESK
jgi:hypothetical protein